MLTKIDLCSMALLKLGEQPIQSLTDDTASAKLSRTLFDPVIDSLITIYPWRFATSEIDLKRNTDGNFQLPPNVLRVLRTSESGRIIGDRIFSDSETVTIIALVRTSTEKFPAYFVSLAATRLAMEFCIPLMGDQTIFRMLVALYETELQTAKFLDASSTTNNGISDFSLISARY